MNAGHVMIWPRKEQNQSFYTERRGARGTGDTEQVTNTRMQSIHTQTHTQTHREEIAIAAEHKTL